MKYFKITLLQVSYIKLNQKINTITIKTEMLNRNIYIYIYIYIYSEKAQYKMTKSSAKMTLWIFWSETSLIP